MLTIRERANSMKFQRSVRPPGVLASVVYQRKEFPTNETRTSLDLDEFYLGVGMRPVRHTKTDSDSLTHAR